MSRNWTNEQLEAITAEGDLLVSAAAGAGKTAVLSERIARLISEGIGVEELLVVTFTKAAAAEMRTRIQKRLNDMAVSCEDAELAARLAVAASSCERANISTLHSFCTSVLHRNYHEADIDPTVSVLDGTESALLMSEALDTALEEAYAKDETDGDGSLYALVKAAKGDDNLAKLVLELYRFAVSRPEPEEWLDRAVSVYSDGFDEAMCFIEVELANESARELKAYMDTARRLRIGLPEEQRGIREALDSDLSQMLALSLCKTYDDWHDALPRISYARLNWLRGTDDTDKAEVKEYREGLKKYIDSVLKKRFAKSADEERESAKRLASPIRKLREIVRVFAEKYSSLKDDRGAVDFNDMEQLTLKVLRNDAISAEYRKKFRYIFVDEYQDINPVQEAILSKISCGNRFMVGDVKQSIYRFRQAEPGIFLEKYRTYKSEGKRRIDLNRNFRSSETILDSVNLLFSKLMNGRVGEIDYSDNAALVSGLGSDKGSDEPCEIVLIEMGGSDSEDDEDIDSAVCEAQYTAKRILHMMENEMLIQNGKSRKYRWSDFAVLLRSGKSSSRQWATTLSDAGIPCISGFGGGFFEATEIKLFLDLLRVIDNRRLDIPLLSVMRSPIFGFTDEDLIHIRSDYDGGELLDSVISASKDNNRPTWSIKARDMLESIEKWAFESRLMSLTDFVGSLIDRTRFNAYCSALYGGTARTANLEALCERARLYSMGGKAGIHGFIRYMDNIKETAALDLPSTPVADAVQLMTVHKSKGLEFPVVFIGGMGRRMLKSYRTDVGIFDSELGIGLCSVAGDTHNKSVIQRAIANREALRLTAEEMRVMYVAMTRARSKLIMVGAGKDIHKTAEKYAAPLDDLRIKRSDKYLDWMLGAYFPQGLGDGIFDIALPHGGVLTLEFADSEKASPVNNGFTAYELESWMQEAEFLETDDMDRIIRSKYRYADETGLPTKFSVTELSGREIVINEKPRFMEGETARDGAAIGTLTHRLLQLIPIRPHTDRSVMEELKKLIDKGFFTQDEARMIRISSVVGFFTSELGQRMTASELCEREKEFNIMMSVKRLIDSDADSTVMLQGIIDCCFIEDGEWVLIDHKTTRVEANRTARSVARRYSTQIDLYAEALQKLTGIPVKEKYIYMLSVDEAVRM